MRGQREMKLGGRHQGELNFWGECCAGKGIRGEELPVKYQLLLRESREIGRVQMGMGAKKRDK